MLAAKLTPRVSSFALPKLCSAKRGYTQNPQKIMEEFQAFYSQLYRSDSPDAAREVDSFLQDPSLPRLTMAHCVQLEAPILEGDVMGVIKQAKTGSAPGPDGFSAVYYKKFATTLSPYITCVAPSSLEKDCR